MGHALSLNLGCAVAVLYILLYACLSAVIFLKKKSVLLEQYGIGMYRDMCVSE